MRTPSSLFHQSRHKLRVKIEPHLQLSPIERTEQTNESRINQQIKLGKRIRVANTIPPHKTTPRRTSPKKKLMEKSKDKDYQA